MKNLFSYFWERLSSMFFAWLFRDKQKYFPDTQVLDVKMPRKAS